MMCDPPTPVEYGAYMSGLPAICRPNDPLTKPSMLMGVDAVQAATNYRDGRKPGIERTGVGSTINTKRQTTGHQ